MIKKTLLHTCIHLDWMEIEPVHTDDMNQYLKDECNDALGGLRKIETVIIEQEKQTTTNNNNQYQKQDW